MLVRIPQPAPSSINLLHEPLGRFLRPFVAGVLLAWRDFDLDRPHVVIGNLLEQVGDAVEPCLLLIVSVDHEPRRVRTVGVSEHLVLGLGILDPVLARLDVHRAQLPALDRVADAVLT